MTNYADKTLKFLSGDESYETEITKMVVDTHHYDKNEEAASHVLALFPIAKLIITDSTQTIETILQTCNPPDNTKLAACLDGKSVGEKLTSPLCILRTIACEIMSCKNPTGDDFEKQLQSSTLDIFKKLEKYSWEGKAIMVLTAFALEYGEFSLLTHLHHSQLQLATSVAMLKRVPVLFDLINTRKDLIKELNNLIKLTFDIINLINELEKFTPRSAQFPDLCTALKQIPTYVYFAVVTLVLCATELTLITDTADKPNYMRQFSIKITKIKKTLEEDYKKFSLIIDGKAGDYGTLVRDIEVTREVTQVFKALKVWEQVQWVQHEEKAIEVSVLKEKYVLVFMSSLEVTHEELKVLTEFYKEVQTKQENKCAVVWVPIVEDCNWTEERKSTYTKKYEELKESTKMKYYAVQTSNQLAVQYMKEQWEYKSTSSKSTASVLLRPNGKVYYKHALQCYSKSGIDFFGEIFGVVTETKKWIHSIVAKSLVHYEKTIIESMKQDKYILLYGGSDSWIGQFEAKSVAFTKQTCWSKSKVEIQSVKLGTIKDEHMVKFWEEVHKAYVAVNHSETKEVTMTEQIQQLYSYKEVENFAVLIRGSCFLTSHHGETTLKVIEKVEEWSSRVTSKETFEKHFIGYHKTVNEKEGLPVEHGCCKIVVQKEEVSSFSQIIKCQVCIVGTMEMKSVTYECCHPTFPRPKNCTTK